MCLFLRIVVARRIGSRRRKKRHSISRANRRGRRGEGRRVGQLLLLLLLSWCRLLLKERRGRRPRWRRLQLMRRRRGFERHWARENRQSAAWRCVHFERSLEHLVACRAAVHLDYGRWRLLTCEQCLAARCAFIM